MKKSLIIVAVAFIAVGIALFTGALVASGFDFSALGGAKYETNEYEVADDFYNISILTKETDVGFKKSDDGKTKVVLVEREKENHSVSVEDGTLKITVEDERQWYERISLFSKSLSLTVYLPSDEYSDLLVEVATGDVSVPDTFSFASAKITTSTGDVSLSASVTGNLEISTSTGNISVAELTAGKLDLSVSTGDVSVRKVSCGGVSVKVSTGKAKLTDLNCSSLVSRGTTGDITLENVVAAENFDVERSTGDVKFINCDASEIKVVTRTGDVTGTLRSEKIFHAKTTTGRSSVPNTVAGGVCDIETTTGDISIAITE